MNDYVKKIDFNQAKRIATESALRRLKPFMDDENISVLSAEFKEADYCWFFFRNEKIVGPPERSLAWDGAYAISKKGTESLIADYSNDPIALNEYLQKMSNYFRDRNL
ncbi:hypothetical protein QCD85_22850 [Paenibacillus sp. PsM32]|uniref:hypothetical protein n=1 Tax=Paenibacillus sp. PsM32 TaxID=3030536 RepID=UPI00263BDA73|nr:hypothetical protein [Paenibacillus sp. PsM32]MDN4620974.1 hypothetical protein [Paenibacillus sp. PsM32]